MIKRISRIVFNKLYIKNYFSNKIQNLISIEPKISNENSTFINGEYHMKFTCNVCEHRQQKKFSKNSYTRGVVWIRCEGCKNLHLIADNLKWFEDKNSNIETIMQEKGVEITKLKANTEWEIIEK